MRILAIIFLSLVIAIACAFQAHADFQNMLKTAANTAPQPEIRSVENVDVEDFSGSQAVIIKAAISAWSERYNCGRALVVRPFKGDTTVMDDGSMTKVDMTAGPGYINLDPDNKFSPRNSVLHAMTDACQPDSPRMLSRPIPFKDGFIIGYHGATILVRLRNGKQVYFRKLDDGISERNASFFPGYSVHDRHVFAVGKLAREHFPVGKEPMKLVKNNDVPGLAAMILNKSEPSDQDIIEVMDMYQGAWSAVSP